MFFFGGWGYFCFCFFQKYSQDSNIEEICFNESNNPYHRSSEQPIWKDHSNTTKLRIGRLQASIFILKKKKKALLSLYKKKDKGIPSK